jgi:hypothetical protein
MIQTFGQSLPVACCLSPRALGIAAHIGDGGPASWAGFIWHRSPAPLFTDRERTHLHFLRWLSQVGYFDEAASQTEPMQLLLSWRPLSADLASQVTRPHAEALRNRRNSEAF